MLFACTKDFLLSNSQSEVGRGKLIDELNSQIDVIIDREIKPVVLHGEFGWDEYKVFKRNILAIRRSEIDPDLKENFIPIAYSIMNVLVPETAFSSSSNESVNSRLKIPVRSAVDQRSILQLPGLSDTCRPGPAIRYTPSVALITRLAVGSECKYIKSLLAG